MSITAALFGAYFLFDVNYFIRTTSTVLMAKYFRKKIGLFDSSTTYGIVLSTDTDINGVNHMNNARVLRELDFCRLDHAARSGQLDLWMKYKAALTGHVVKYRLPLMLFSPYKVITRPVYWDDKTLYFEQRFVTLKDGIVRSIVFSSVGLRLDFDKYCQDNLPHIKKPQIPEEIKKWKEINDITSEALKAKL